MHNTLTVYGYVVAMSCSRPFQCKTFQLHQSLGINVWEQVGRERGILINCMH
jgi:hypothetical protein